MLYRLGIIGGICLLLACDNQEQTGLAEVAIATPVAADACSYYYHSRLKKNVYTKVEVEAEFPGGSVAKARFINKNLLVTAADGEFDPLQSHVAASFVVDTDGSVKAIEIDGKSDTSQYIPLEKAFVRAIRSMPKWYPATCNGTPVASQSKQSMVVCFREGE